MNARSCVSIKLYYTAGGGLDLIGAHSSRTPSPEDYGLSPPALPYLLGHEQYPGGLGICQTIPPHPKFPPEKSCSHREAKMPWHLNCIFQNVSQGNLCSICIGTTHIVTLQSFRNWGVSQRFSFFQRRVSEAYLCHLPPCTILASNRPEGKL